MIADLAVSRHFWYRWYDRLGESPERKRRNPTWIPASRQRGCRPQGRCAGDRVRRSTPVCVDPMEASVRVA